MNTNIHPVSIFTKNIKMKTGLTSTE